MNGRAFLAVLTDISVLSLGLGGVIHEEFFTHEQRPALIGLYGLLLAGQAYAKGRKLVQVLSKLTEEDEDGELPASTTRRGTSGRPPSPPRSPSRRR